MLGISVTPITLADRSSYHVSNVTRIEGSTERTEKYVLHTPLSQEAVTSQLHTEISDSLYQVAELNCFFFFTYII